MSFAPTEQGRTGYLLKKGRINTDWKLRFFVQQGPKVSYYLNEEKMEEGAKPYGSILLEQSVVRPCAEDVGKDYCFEIITKDRVYRLVANSHEDMLGWIAALVPFTLLHAENEWIKRAEFEITTGVIDLGDKFDEIILRRYNAPSIESLAEAFGFEHAYSKTNS